jgi:hypothetical protein
MGRELRKRCNNDVETLPSDRLKERSDSAVNWADAIARSILKRTVYGGGINVGKKHLPGASRGCRNSISAGSAAEI